MLTRGVRSVPTSRRNGLQARRTYATESGKKVAVVLSGAGVHDGTEITEAVSAIVSFSRVGHELDFFAPAIDQTDVFNHATGLVDEYEERDAMIEAARITRGKISKLSDLKTEEYDALFIPGGFGAAKTLSSFAKDGEKCTVLPDLARVIQEFHASQKPIAACCIAPVIVAKVLGAKAGGPGVTVTVGNDAATMSAIEKMGATPVVAGPTDVVVDEQNYVMTSPAYMYPSQPHVVFDGISALVSKIFSVSKRGVGASEDSITADLMGVLRSNADQLGLAAAFAKKDAKTD